jgi:hypothetical protein
VCSLLSPHCKRLVFSMMQRSLFSGGVVVLSDVSSLSPSLSWIHYWSGVWYLKCGVILVAPRHRGGDDNGNSVQLADLCAGRQSVFILCTLDFEFYIFRVQFS